jgi:hypothetical protein
VEGGAAWQDGRLEAGDQLLAVDGHSLVGITQVSRPASSPGLISAPWCTRPDYGNLKYALMNRPKIDCGFLFNIFVDLSNF